LFRPALLQHHKVKTLWQKRTPHTSFDHERFAKNMKECKHLWLITYDDCEEVRSLFSFAYIYSWKLQYGVTAKKVKEIFITNYKAVN
jgi:DNA adenine methylase